MKIKVSGIIRESIVDGPGIRYTIFMQGCLHNCFNCHNPQTHDFNLGYYIDIEEIINDIKANPLIAGITISGGEPFMQIDALNYLVKRLVQENIHIIIYSGYLFEDLMVMNKKEPQIFEVLKGANILIDGPYKEKFKDLDLKYRGSSNQRVIDLRATFSNNKIKLISL